MMKKLFAILALSSGAGRCTACNTVRGAGQDVQSAANAVDERRPEPPHRHSRISGAAFGRRFFQARPAAALRAAGAR